MISSRCEIASHEVRDALGICIGGIRPGVQFEQKDAAPKCENTGRPFQHPYFRAFDIGRQAIAIDLTFAGLTAKGIGIWIGVQAFINMGVNLGLLPTKGLTLPLMSYGGSGVLINCIGLAILLRIDYENRLRMRGGRA